MTPKNGRGWTLDLTPGTPLTLTLSEAQKAQANVIVFDVPGATIAGTAIAGFGIALTSGAPGKTATPVTPTPNALPGVAGPPDDPEITGRAIWTMTLRAPEWRFLLDAGAPGIVRVRVQIAFDQATEMTGADQAQPRRIA